MGEFDAILRRTPLMNGIDAKDYARMLQCLGAHEAEIPAGAMALAMGDAPDHIGIVLLGQMQVVRVDADGGRALLASLWPGDYYGEALACAGVKESPVCVEAAAPSRVLKLPFAGIVKPREAACPFHRMLAWNLATIIAKKNLMLQKRMEILERKSIRERVMLFLAGQMGAPGKRFTVAMNRSEMAAYLAVDRSALSRELARLMDEGAIEFDKSRFVVHQEARPR